MDSDQTPKSHWAGILARVGLLVGLLVLVHFSGHAALDKYRDILVPDPDSMGIWPLIGGALVFHCFWRCLLSPGWNWGWP